MPSPVSRICRFACLAAALALVACAPKDSSPDAASPGERPAGAAGPQPASDAALTVAAFADEVSADRIVEHVKSLSSDAFGGRGPASEGDRLTQQYLSEQLEAMGYRPGAADGGWLQPFDIVGINAAVPSSWTFSSGDDERSFTVWDDFVASSGVQAPVSAVENAEVVFVGYGIQAPEYDWDDYKGLDVSGKILLMMNNDPEWDPALFEGVRRLYYGRWDYKYEMAAKLGAAGAIIIHTTPSAGYPWQVVQTSWTGEQFELPARDEPRTRISAWLTEEAAADLVAMAGQDLPALIESARSREFELTGLTILRAAAKHHYGPHGFLTEGVDWNDHVGQQHHIDQAKYGAIQYTEPFLNNQHIAEPTLFYLEKLAGEGWRDAEGNVLWSRPKNAD